MQLAMQGELGACRHLAVHLPAAKPSSSIDPWRRSIDGEERDPRSVFHTEMSKTIALRDQGGHLIPLSPQVYMVIAPMFMGGNAKDAPRVAE